MSYNIGQFLSSQLSDIDSYLKPIIGDDIQITTQRVQSIESDNIIFENCCINLTSNHVLSSEECYYLKFKVKQQETIQKFYLKLKNNQNSNSGTQLIEEFTVNTGNENNYNYFEVIISPNSNGYNQIIWELQRITEDYTTVHGDTNGRVMEITIQTYGQLKNLISELNLGGGSSYLTKIGIQGPPSLLMCINREPIRIGRSGIYEINNGVNISSISFVPKENDGTLVDYFIMDYEY